MAVKSNPRFHRDSVNTLAVSDDSTLAVSGCVDGSTMLLHLKTGKIVNVLSPHSESVEAAAFSHSS